MIQSIHLEHFKCFESATLPLGGLTVFTGSNAAGKSSALQALLLLSQTIRESELQQQVLLNGRHIQMGVVSDVVDQLTSRQACSIGIETNKQRYVWRLKGDRGDSALSIESLTVDERIVDTAEGMISLLPPVEDREVCSILRGLNYVSAERAGPRGVYPLHEVASDHWVGSKGEYAASVLFQFRDLEVAAGLILAGIPRTFMPQVEGTMSEFFPGFSLEVDRIPGTNSVVLRLRTSPELEFCRPVNVGFGITQVLPIIVAALVMLPGGLLIVENPEVHLHPRGQSLMGQFLARVAATGVQVIVETHSDHIVNGVRKAVKAGLVESELVCMHYFAERSGPSQVQTVKVRKDGTLDYWPQGFFDQYEADLSALISRGDDGSHLE